MRRAGGLAADHAQRGHRLESVMTFELSHPSRDTTRLTITGELDAATVKLLQPTLGRLVDAEPPLVEIDLHRLRLIDSAGVFALVRLCKQLEPRNHQVRIVGLCEQPAAMFQVLRLDRLMTAAGASPP